MRIAYVGNFKHSWCTEVHVARDAERIPGVKVERLQEPTRDEDPRRFLRNVEHTASVCDLLIYQRTWGLPPETIELWRRLEKRGCKTASYHLDLYFGLQREATIVGDPFWQTGICFTADGDPNTQRRLEDLGIDHAWLPAACVSDEVAWPESGVTNPNFPDVAFVGSAPNTYHPEWPWRQVLLDALSHRYGRRFRRYPIDNHRLHGRPLNTLYQSVPVIIGDSLALPGHTNYWSDRYYETVGRGGFLVAPNVPGIETQFTSGEHLDLYEIGDLEQVFELVDQALADPDAARAIARAGRAHVYDHHTYTHRVRSMLRSLGLMEDCPDGCIVTYADAECPRCGRPVEILD